MKLPFRRKAITGTPEILQTLADRSGVFVPGLGGTNFQSRVVSNVWATAQGFSYAATYANSPAVRIVVDLIARNIAQLDLRLYEEVDENERQPANDHPAAVSLRYPSTTQTPDQFVRSMVQSFLLYGNAYALKFRNPESQTITFKVVPARLVTIEGLNLFDPEAYRITRLDGTWFDVLPQDVLHWRGENPIDPRLGISPLETLRDVIAEDAALQAASVELAKSGLTQATYVKRPLEAPEWTNDARKGFEEDLVGRLRKANRKPPVMEEGMELVPLGISPVDAQMLEARKWALEQIATQLGVPLGMIGLANGVGADQNAARSQFYADTLPPYCEGLARQLDLSVCQQEYGETDLCFEFNLDEKMMGDERLSALTSASGRPVLLTNEARAKLNLPPVDDGDELVTPLNVIVGDNPRPAPAVMGPQDPNGPPQDGSHRLPPGEEPKAIEPRTKAILHPTHKADMARQHRYIDEAQGLLEAYYGRQARSLAGKAALDSERWNRELAADLQKLIKSIVEREGGIYVARLAGDDFDYRLVDHYVKATAAGVAEAINAVTEQDIQELGAEEALKRARGERASVAAASIGTRSTVFARTEAAKQAPNPERRMKTWMADTARHAQLNGETVPLGEDFSLGFEPGGPPNCRCSLIVQ